MRIYQGMTLWGPPLKMKVGNMLLEIEIYQYREAQEIWELLPEKQWEALKTLNVVNLREQQLLAIALRNLRNAFMEIFNACPEIRD